MYWILDLSLYLRVLRASFTYRALVLRVGIWGARV